MLFAVAVPSIWQAGHMPRHSWLASTLPGDLYCANLHYCLNSPLPQPLHLVHKPTNLTGSMCRAMHSLLAEWRKSAPHCMFPYDVDTSQSALWYGAWDEPPRKLLALVSAQSRFYLIACTKELECSAWNCMVDYLNQGRKRLNKKPEPESKCNEQTRQTHEWENMIGSFPSS